MVCPALVVLGIRGTCSNLLLRLSRNGSRGGFFSLSLCLLVQSLPQLHMQQVFLVPCSFFVSCCWRRGVSMCKQGAKDRRLSQPVSGGSRQFC